MNTLLMVPSPENNLVLSSPSIAEISWFLYPTAEKGVSPNETPNFPNGSPTAM